MKPGITEIIFHCSIKTDDSKADDSSGAPGSLGSEKRYVNSFMSMKYLELRRSDMLISFFIPHLRSWENYFFICFRLLTYHPYGATFL
jgi:hypothetical protein